MEVSNSPVSSTQPSSSTPGNSSWNLVSSSTVGVPPPSASFPVLADPSLLMVLSHYGQVINKTEETNQRRLNYPYGII